MSTLTVYSFRNLQLLGTGDLEPNSFKLAPKNQKLTVGSTGKSGTSGLPPKSTNKSISKSSYSTSSPKPSSAKLPTITPSTSSLPSLPQFSGKNKSSTTFGVIWLPTRKKNKHKEYAYNAYQSKQREKERTPTMYNFMSGDSSNHNSIKKIEEESSLLVSDKTPAVLGGVGAATVLDDAQPDASNNKETNELQQDARKDDFREDAGDSINEKDCDYLENNEKVISKPPQSETKDKLADNVDSVFLKPQPAHKTRTNTPTPEDESCGMKCLYYTLQCCDCVLM